MEELATQTIGPKIKEARIKAGVSQQTLATEAGVSIRTLVRIEQGEDARLSTLQRIASTLEISVSDLMKEDS